MMDEGDDRVRATYGEELRAAGGGQEEVRPGESVPGESEHQALTDAVALRRVHAHRHRDLGDRATDDAEGLAAPAAVPLPPLHRAYLDRINVGFAALQMNAALGFVAGGLRLRRRHLLRRLHAVRGPEQHHPRARRRAALDRAHHDHVGARSRARMMFVHGAEQLLRAALSARARGSRLLPRHHLLPDALVSRARERARTIAAFMTAFRHRGHRRRADVGALLLARWTLRPGGLAVDVPRSKACPRSLLGVVVLFALTERPADADMADADERTRWCRELDEEGRATGTHGRGITWRRAEES